MPNYSITINSKFRPFSYAEMLAPVQAMTEAHQAIEDQYSELMTKASVWESMANEQTDPQAYNMYKSYADQLLLAADDLSRNGLTAQSRPQLMALKAGYAKHIAPIETAYNRRLAQIDKQEALAAQNPSLIFDREASKTSLDAYLKNPELSYHSISGNDVREHVLQQAAAIAKEPGLNTLKHIVGNNDFYEYIQRYGRTSKAVMAAILDSPDADNVLTTMVNNAVDATGVRNWKTASGKPNEEAIRRVTDYAKEGLWGAVGTGTSQITPDWRRQEDQRYSNHIKEIEKQAEEQRKLAELNAKLANDAKYTNIEDENGNIIGKIDETTGRQLNSRGNIVVDTKGNTVTPIIPLTSEQAQKEQKKQDAKQADETHTYGDLRKMNTWKAVTEGGYIPIMALSRYNPNKGNFLGFGRDVGFWQAATNNKDIEHTFLAGTRGSALEDSFGDYDIKGIDKKTPVKVLNEKQVEALMNTEQGALLYEALTKAGMNEENVQIVRVNPAGRHEDYVVVIEGTNPNISNLKGTSVILEDNNKIIKDSEGNTQYNFKSK